MKKVFWIVPLMALIAVGGYQISAHQDGICDSPLDQDFIKEGHRYSIMFRDSPQSSSNELADTWKRRYAGKVKVVDESGPINASFGQKIIYFTCPIKAT